MSRRTITPHQMMITAPVLRQPPPNWHHSRSLIYVEGGLLPCRSAVGTWSHEIMENGHTEAVIVVLVVLRDQPKSRLLKMTPQIPTMTMIYRRNRKSVISTLITYLINVYRVFNHLSVYSDFLSLSPLRLSIFGWLITHFNLLHTQRWLLSEKKRKVALSSLWVPTWFQYDLWHIPPH